MINNSRLLIKKMDYPHIIGISISNLCNRNCHYCIRRSYVFNDKNELMPIHNFEKLLCNIVGKTDCLNISAGYGEALLHPDIGCFINMVRQSDIKLLCYTNGILMKKHIDLLPQMDILILSANKNTFSDKYKLFLKELKSSVIVSLIIDLYINDFSYIMDLCEFCDLHHVNIELHWLFNNTREKKKSIDCVDRELKIIKEMKSSFVHLPSDVYYKYIHCKDLWRSLYFDINGYLRTCCVFNNYTKEYNIFRDSIEEIWGSEYLEKCRDMFCLGIEPDYCKTCPIGHGNVGGYHF